MGDNKASVELKVDFNSVCLWVGGEKRVELYGNRGHVLLNKHVEHVRKEGLRQIEEFVEQAAPNHHALRYLEVGVEYLKGLRTREEEKVEKAAVDGCREKLKLISGYDFETNPPADVIAGAQALAENLGHWTWGSTLEHDLHMAKQVLEKVEGVREMWGQVVLDARVGKVHPIMCKDQTRQVGPVVVGQVSRNLKGKEYVDAIVKMGLASEEEGEKVKKVARDLLRQRGIQEATLFLDKVEERLDELGDRSAVLPAIREELKHLQGQLESVVEKHPYPELHIRFDVVRDRIKAELWKC